MQDVEHAMSILRERTGLADLAFNSEGAAELVIDDILSVYLVRVSPDVLEVATRLDGLDDRIDLAVMQRMLLANGVGTEMGSARLALDHETGTALLCDQIEVGSLDADRFDRRMTEFVKQAAYWAGEGSLALVAGGSEPVLQMSEITEDAIRV